MATNGATKTYADVWADTVRFVSPIVAAVVVVLALLIGGVGLLPVGLAVAAVASLVLTTLVAYFRLQRGAGGFPRRWPVQPGDLVGGWHVLGHLRSQVRPDGTYLARRGPDYGVLKIAYHAQPTEDDPRHRALREANYLESVSSRHVVPLLDSDSTETYSYLVSRYLGERTVWDRRQAGTPPDAELFSIAAGSLKGLIALHEHDITHRDLTPRNVIVDERGAATLIDLGIAIADTTTRLTKTRAQIFTIGYKAPEQFSGPATPKSDVFVWASTIYYLATGTEAFPGDEAEAQGRILSQPPELQTCPTWLQPALGAAFTTDPGRRPTASQLLERLSSNNTAGWTIYSPQPVPAPRVQRLPSWLGASLIAAALTLTPIAALLFVLDANDPVITTDDEALDPTPDDGSAQDDSSDNQGNDGQQTPEGLDEPDDLGADEEPPPTTELEAPTTTPPTTEPPNGPIADFVGVWHGESLGANNPIPVVFAIDEPTAVDEGAPIGSWFYFSCTGPLRLVSATSTLLEMTPVEPDPEDCGFGGQVTLTRSADSAAYDWTSSDGATTRSGTFSRTPKITLSNPGWPTSRNEVSQAFFANLGVCATGASGCSESGQFPDWTACTTNDLCIAGGGASVVDVWRNLTWVLEIPQSAPNTAIALLAVGFTEDQVIDLLDI